MIMIIEKIINFFIVNILYSNKLNKIFGKKL